MAFRENFINQLIKINDSNFNKKAFELFNYQYQQVEIYREYANSIGRSPEKVNDSLYSIPFLPVDFYKTKKVLVNSIQEERIFYSSGTTQKEARSKHYVADTSLYENVFSTTFQAFYGYPEEYIFLALLPSYQENPDSSLLYMIESLVEQSNSSLSGFVSLNFDYFLDKLPEYRAAGRKIILIGVAYALLELAERYAPDLSDFIIMETGGMKGRRKEMIKAELHTMLCSAFNVPVIHSEYGMTELFSQAYSLGKGIYRTPPWMKVMVREVADPFAIDSKGRGGLNIIDLANVDSCAFIEIQDMGIAHADGSFEVLGRMDNSEARGCNLLYG